LSKSSAASRPRTGKSALILRARGELDEAMALMKEQERLCRELGDRAGLQASLGYQAVILDARGESDTAMALLKEQERLCRELGDKPGLQVSLGNQADILVAREDPDEAVALLKERERLCRELGDPSGLAQSLVNQAALFPANYPRKVLGLAEEAYEVAVSAGLTRLASQIEPLLDHVRVQAGEAQPTLAPVRSPVAEGRPTTPGRPRQLEGAIELLDQQIEVQRALGQERKLAESLLDQAELLVGVGERSSAREKAAEARIIFTKLDLPVEAARASAVQIRSRMGTPGRGKALLAGALLLALAGLGVAMGLWNPWLWLIGGPLILFSVFIVAVSASPRLQQAHNDAVRRLAED
jgi:tetratricopeptide (TPR) repeat protein